MTRRSGSVSMRITVSDVWKGTPDSATTGGTVGRPPAATIWSAVSATSGPSTCSSWGPVNRAWPS